jgi:transposase
MPSSTSSPRPQPPTAVPRLKAASRQAGGAVLLADGQAAAALPGLRSSPLPRLPALAGIRPRIARRRLKSSARLGRHRWTIERTGAWLGGWRRLRIRYERSSERFYALAMLACAVICFNALQQPPW